MAILFAYMIFIEKWNKNVAPKYESVLIQMIRMDQVHSSHMGESTLFIWDQNDNATSYASKNGGFNHYANMSV